jgi:hypothetical protein
VRIAQLKSETASRIDKWRREVNNLGSSTEFGELAKFVVSSCEEQLKYLDALAGYDS